MDFVSRLVDRTLGGKPTLKPIVRPWGSVAREPFVLEEVREIEQPPRDDGDDAHVGPVASVVSNTRPLVSAPQKTASSAQHSIEAAPPGSVASPLVATRANDVPSVRVSSARQPSREHTGEPPGGIAPAQVVPPSAIPAPRTSRERAVTSRGATGANAAPRGLAPAAEPPVVRVHIGRVEVRAAPPPPVAKRPSDPLPSVALARYLDERGRRR